MSDQNEPPVIVVINNGPYRVIGDNITIKDVAGNTFGLAGRTVVSLCRCDCGNETAVVSRNLSSGKTRSCDMSCVS